MRAGAGPRSRIVTSRRRVATSDKEFGDTTVQVRVIIVRTSVPAFNPYGGGVPFSVQSHRKCPPSAIKFPRNTAHKKDPPPPIFLRHPAAADCTTAQSDGWSSDTRCAIRFFLPVRERVTSLPLPHHTCIMQGFRGGFQRIGGVLRPFNLGTPPCPLGVQSPGGPKSVPPVRTIITRTCNRYVTGCCCR